MPITDAEHDEVLRAIGYESYGLAHWKHPQVNFGMPTARPALNLDSPLVRTQMEDWLLEHGSVEIVTQSRGGVYVGVIFALGIIAKGFGPIGEALARCVLEVSRAAG